MLKALQVVFALLTIALAVLNEIVVHVWWVPDRSSVGTIALIDGPMILIVLAGLLAIAIAESRRYEFNIVLMVVTLLTVSCALLVFFGDPLAFLVASSLLVTAIVSGIAMQRAWLHETVLERAAA